MNPANKQISVFVACAAAVVAIAALILWPTNDPRFDERPSADAARRTDEDGKTGTQPRPGKGGKPGETVEPGFVIVGGVKRPVTDVAPAAGQEKAKPVASGDDWIPEDVALEYGRTPPVKSDANPQVKLVSEAIRTGKHPERLSVLHPPAPFDWAKYQADPEKYLAVPEPGRVYQTAKPDLGVPVLAPTTSRFLSTPQGEPITLEVETLPNSPVTFTSFDLGRFSNLLTTMTVAADDNGCAQVEFTGAPGTIDDVEILAGSPMASGQVKFIVHVLPPAKTETAAAAQ